MTGMILAGGENRRMGRDKAFLELGGRPVIELVLEVFRELFGRIIVVTNTPERYRPYDVEVIQDALDLRCPLTGIYSGLLASRDDLHFVAACDMPFLNGRLISHLLQTADTHDAVVPLVNGLPEPLHAVYRRRIAPVIGDQLRRGERKISRLFDVVDVRYATDEEVARFDPQRRSFRNLNTPADYKEAVCSDWECRN